MALSYGLRWRKRLWSAAGQEEFRKFPLREGLGRRREDLVRLVRQLSAWITELDQRIEAEAARREDAQRLMTHPGVGPQTALASPTLHADLTIQFAGHTAEYKQVPFQRAAKGNEIEFNGTIPLKISDFKIKPPELLMIPIKNGVPVQVDTTWHAQ